MECLAVIWLVHVGLFATCSAQNQNVSTMAVCDIFATNDTAYVVCSTAAYMVSPTYMLYGGDPCLTASNTLMCDRLDFLSPTSCLSESSVGVIEGVLSSIPTSVTLWKC